MDIAQAISDYGFPIIAAIGMGYFIFFIWKWVTETIDPVLGKTMGTLIKLVDRVRMLDNDMIRLNSKLSIVLEHRGMDDAVAKFTSHSQTFNSTGEEHVKKENSDTSTTHNTPPGASG
jgi:hypothetical protein|tara:strand:- start:199 stop:552 length:354 start_codon:yes stop_codon:yes gene_type:complete